MIISIIIAMATITAPGERNGNPLQYSCLENPIDRGAWRATVHSVAKGQTRLKRLSARAHTHTQLAVLTGQEVMRNKGANFEEF